MNTARYPAGAAAASFLRAAPFAHRFQLFVKGTSSQEGGWRHEGFLRNLSIYLSGPLAPYRIAPSSMTIMAPMGPASGAGMGAGSGGLASPAQGAGAGASRSSCVVGRQGEEAAQCLERSASCPAQPSGARHCAPVRSLPAPPSCWRSACCTRTCTGSAACALDVSSSTASRPASTASRPAPRGRAGMAGMGAGAPVSDPGEDEGRGEDVSVGGQSRSRAAGGGGGVPPSGRTLPRPGPPRHVPTTAAACA